MLDSITLEAMDAEIAAMMSRLKLATAAVDNPPKNSECKIVQYRSELKQNLDYWIKLIERVSDKEYAAGYVDGLKRCLKAFDDIFYPDQTENGDRIIHDSRCAPYPLSEIDFDNSSMAAATRQKGVSYERVLR